MFPAQKVPKQESGTMKMNTIRGISMTQVFKFFLITSVLLVLSAPSQAALFVLSGNIDVFQATTNPSDVGSGAGTISGDYNDTTNSLNYSIEWNDLTSAVTNMHFHVGAVGVPGGIDLSIPGPWSSPQLGSGIALDVSQETNLLAGLWYVNVHTDDFLGGEIRGQVNVAVIPVPPAVWLFGSALGLLGWIRRKKAS
jgi:hypothetical protein